MAGGNGKTQYIAVTVDFCDGIITSRSVKNYEVVYAGCTVLHKELRAHSNGEDIRFTFFVRADNQVKYNFDRVSHFYDLYRDFWLEVTSAGDEIGWHPHLYRLRGSLWMPQTDGPGVERQIRSCYTELPMDAFYITSARIGEGRMTNYAVNILDKVGLKVDSTALPGRKRDDDERAFNWLKAPPTPYHPSRFDYGVPGMPGGNLELLEVPFTMVKMQAPYDPAPLKRYLDLTFEPDIVRPGLKAALEESPYTVCVVHPSFILEAPETHELIRPGIDTVRKNIENICEAASSLGRDIKFVRIRDMYELVTGQKAVADG